MNLEILWYYFFGDAVPEPAATTAYCPPRLTLRSGEPMPDLMNCESGDEN